MTNRSLGCAVLVVACIAACKGRTQPYAGSGASLDDPVKIPAPRVTLREAGQEPRRELRYKITDYSRDIHFWQGLGQGEGLAAETIEWHCSPCTYLLARFSMGPDEALDRSETQGIRGRVDLTNDGRVTVSVSSSSFHVTPDPTEFLLIFMVPFPREPIGVGAVWSVQDDDYRTEYKLLEVSDTAAQVHFDRRRIGPSDRYYDGTFTVTFADVVSRGTLSQRILKDDGTELGEPTTFTFD